MKSLGPPKDRDVCGWVVVLFGFLYLTRKYEVFHNSASMI